MYGGSTAVEDKRLFLSLRTLPARLGGTEAGWVLGFNREEISLLTSKGHLKALGKPSTHAQKYYSSAQLFQHANDHAWLDKATRILLEAWRKKNAAARASGET